ncbi:MAG: histidine kinase N-terminal 7TM domain-containing protein [Dehalococcoidales bacterium]|nr:histidine kinase N-terminal 7TM domain-containing protein [Dehalococcoidales bacterium]
MQLAYTPYILPLLLAILIALFLIARVWKHRKRRVASAFLLLMFSLAWWASTAALEHASVELSANIFWLKMTYFGITLIPGTWLVFTLLYTDRHKWLTKRNIILLTIIPVVTLVIVWTNSYHHLMWKDIWLDTSLWPPVDLVTHNGWFWVYSVYSYVLLLACTLLILDLFRRSSGIYRKQAGIILAASLVPWAANFLFIAGIKPFAFIDHTPLALTITGVAFFLGLSRFKLLDIKPIAYEVVFKSMLDGVVILDTDYKLVDINQSAQKILNQKREEVIGQPFNTLLPGKAQIAALKADTTSKETVITIEDGTDKRYYTVFISPVSAHNNPNGYLVLLHDNTEQRKAEADSRERIRLKAELAERKHTQKLEAEAQAAKLANQAKSEFLASMSHELRTPLNAVIGFAQVLCEQDFGPLNQKQMEYVNAVVESGRHLLSLINDILDLSKIEAGKEELLLSNIKIKDLLQGSLFMIKERAAKHNISLFLKAINNIDNTEIMADERKLKQVLFNLLSNAVKFTPDGGAITVKGNIEGEEVIISVSDNGIGIKPADQKKLFQRFFQIHGSTTDKTPGTGLGLVISKQLVETHEGEIWVESEGEEKGSQFSFSLPLKRKNAAKTKEESGHPA